MSDKIPKSFDTASREANAAGEARRLFRIMSEFVEATERMDEIRPAVSVFGSARVPADHPYYALAEKTSRLLSDAGFSVVSGGGPGIMEAANRGAAEAGGSSLGLSIQLPHEQRSNPYITPELNFCFHYFFMRKLWFAQMAKALIVFPGGFGTMDELWEMLTLLQTDKLSCHHLILIYGRKYWDKVLNWRHMVRTGTISDREYKLLQFADGVDEAFDRVRSQMEEHHLALDAGWDHQ